MWALLRDNDPGDRAADLAVDDPKPKKRPVAAVGTVAAAEVEVVDPPGNNGTFLATGSGGKPAKHGAKTKAKNKKGAAGDKQAAAAVVADAVLVPNGRKEGRRKLKETPAAVADSEVQTNGRKESRRKLKETTAAVAYGDVQTNGRKESRRKGRETPAAAPSKGAEMSGGVDGGYESDGDVAGGGRCRAVAGRICKAALAVAFLAFWCQLASAPHVAGGRIV